MLEVAEMEGACKCALARGFCFRVQCAMQCNRQLILGLKGAPIRNADRIAANDGICHSA